MAGAAKRPLSPLKTLFSYLKPYPIHLIGALLAMLIAAVAVLAIGQGIKLLIDSGFNDSYASPNYGALILLAISLFMAVASFFRYYLVAWLGEKLVADIRQDFFSHILSQDALFFGTHRTSDLSARLITDTTVIQTVVSGAIPVAARNAILFTGGFIMLWVTSAKLAAAILITIPLVLLPLIVFGRYVRRQTKLVQEKMATANMYAEETFSGIKTVQAFSHEAIDQQHYNDITNNVFQTAARRNLFRGLLSSTVIAFVFSAIVWMVWQGSRLVINNEMTGGDLAAFLFYALLTATSVNALSELYGELQKASAAAERIFSILQLMPTIKSPENPVDLPVAPYTLTFKNVSFAYPNTPQPVYENLELEFSANSFTAISGVSGKGKSTLFLLLLRFYDPQSGQVLLNGIDIKNFDLQEYRQLFALVSQDAPLFSTSIEENMRYGDGTASDMALRTAAEQAKIHQHIESLDNGYRAMIGEKGTELSGGQRQRLAIARALLRHAPILLLDEATAALDPENEQAVLENIQHTHAGSILMISHRQSVNKQAEKVVVI